MLRLAGGSACAAVTMAVCPAFGQQIGPTPPTSAQVQSAAGGGIPALLPQQLAALGEMAVGLAPFIEAATAARDALVAATFLIPRRDAAIRERTDALRAAEWTLATARA